VRVLLFGASGMVGQGVLLECLRSPLVAEVVCVVRTPLAQSDPKFHQVIQSDVTDLSPLGDLSTFAACFFPLGVSSAGMKEEAYRKVTHDLTLAVARPLAAANPSLTFVYVSGAGTDSTEAGKSMWARVKGKTENDLLALLPNAYMLRPGAIRALDGIRSRTALYRRLYVVVGPLLALAARVRPGSVVTTRTIGQAMLALANNGYPRRILEPKDIHAAAAARTLAS